MSSDKMVLKIGNKVKTINFAERSSIEFVEEGKLFDPEEVYA